MRDDQAPAEDAMPSCEPGARTQPQAVPRWAGAAILLASLALAACQTDGSGMANSSAGLAFVSIDGPPRPTFDRLVADLSTQAETQRVKVASRDDPSAYKVKGYLSMLVDRGKGTVVYAWDVYDPENTRVARITGEEKVGKVKVATAWTACDDQVIARIANRSMADLAQTFSATPDGEPAAAADATRAAASAPQPAEAPAVREPATPGPASGKAVADAGEAGSALAYATN